MTDLAEIAAHNAEVLADAAERFTCAQARGLAVAEAVAWQQFAARLSEETS